MATVVNKKTAPVSVGRGGILKVYREKETTSN